jgi:hypothetical protein
MSDSCPRHHHLRRNMIVFSSSTIIIILADAGMDGKVPVHLVGFQ